MKGYFGLLGLLFFSLATKAQADQINPHNHHKIFSDKITEIVIPLAFLFLLLNQLVEVLRIRAEARIKEKMIDKGISENTLVKIFEEANQIRRLQLLKWSLVALANGIPLLIFHFGQAWFMGQSGYFAMGIIMLFNASAFFVYYRMISKRG